MFRLLGKFRQVALPAARSMCQPAEPALTDGEKKLESTLRLKFPSATEVEVRDISGGCGAMYEVFIESLDFKGLNIVKQHKKVNEALAEDIKKMHGLRISTSVPKETKS